MSNRDELVPRPLSSERVESCKLLFSLFCSFLQKWAHCFLAGFVMAVEVEAKSRSKDCPNQLWNTTETVVEVVKAMRGAGLRVSISNKCFRDSLQSAPADPNVQIGCSSIR